MSGDGDTDFNLMGLELPTMSDMEAAKIITCTIDGYLDEEDVRGLVAGEEAEQASARIAPHASLGVDPKRIREKHHSVARLAAQGLAQNLIAQLSGYTQSYLSTLLASPSMQELIGHYRAQNNTAAEVIGERLRSVGLQAVDKIEDALVGEVALPDLVSIAKLGLDRSGHGPSQRIDHNHQHTVVAASDLEALNDAARARSAERILPRPTLLEHVPSVPEASDANS